MNHRRSIRLRHHDYSIGVYFITLVTHKRRRLFGEIRDRRMFLSPAGWEARAQWLNMKNIRWNIRLDEFIVMPDHIHALIWLKNKDSPFDYYAFRQLPDKTVRKFSGPQGPSLSTIVGSYKAGLSKHLRLFDPSLGELWQRDYFEEIVRNKTELESYRRYIRSNPENWKG